MSQILLENARIFDGFNESCPEGMSVLIEGDCIREISATPIKAPDARRIDVAGKTLMPGLIDLHIHAYFSDVNVKKVDLSDIPYRTAHAVRMLNHALDCGFTTLRDIGGGDWSLAMALSDGLIRGPRYFYAGNVLSMTGGHGDNRTPGEAHHHKGYCSCGSTNFACKVVDGVDECLKAVREELRRGAHCIKIMASGGVASPTDPLWMNQFREDEIRTIVNECVERRTYVAAHCHPAHSARRSVDLGVRCIEHGTMIDAETAAYVAEHGAYVVPTLAITWALVERGAGLGFPPQSLDKIRIVQAASIEGLDHMRTAGVKLGYGTDLLGSTYVEQCREFTLRSQVFSPIELLRQATSMGAEILMQDGKLGCIAEGAHADIIVVDGDPLTNIDLLAQDGRRLDLIMRAGEIIKNRLD
ncbi:amidohydrolase family protein [Sphingobium sp.]|uniref:metal-dependent hydrolase family protein n=1 Tax=Sphingobium sp. TaxID=1912891 RepID=UPI003B3BAF92